MPHRLHHSLRCIQRSLVVIRPDPPTTLQDPLHLRRPINGLASTSCPPRFNTSTQTYSSASREVTTRRGWCGSTCSAAKRSLQSPHGLARSAMTTGMGRSRSTASAPTTPVAELNAREGRFRPKKRSWGEELPGDTKSNHLRGAAVCSTLVHPVNVTATPCSRLLMCPCDKPRRLRGRIPASTPHRPR